MWTILFFLESCFKLRLNPTVSKFVCDIVPLVALRLVLAFSVFAYVSFSQLDNRNVLTIVKLLVWIFPLDVFEVWCLLAVFPHSLVNHISSPIELTHSMAHILKKLSFVVVAIFPDVDTVT